jgi:hypothetical protein
MRRRSALVKEAWANHLDGRYASAAALVLTQVEGIVMDATGGRPFFSRRGTKAAVRDESTIAGLPAALPSLRDLFTEPVSVTAADGSLSRHGVLHGRELGFGTEVYSAKVFCLLACVMEWSRSLFEQVSYSLQLELEMTHAGLLGTTSKGVKLDDRESAATKAALKKTREDVARQYGRVHSVEATKTLIANLAMFGLDNVDPASCFVTVRSKDEWYAWRVTPGNWCLGICDQRDSTCSVWDAETPPSNESSLCQASISMGCWGAFVRPAVPVVVALRAGPGVTSPKNRLSGCETGHAGFESFLLVLPDPLSVSWRDGSRRREAVGRRRC